MSSGRLSRAFNFASQQQFGNDCGRLVFVAALVHLPQVLSQPSLIKQLPAPGIEMRLQFISVLFRASLPQAIPRKTSGSGTQARHATNCCTSLAITALLRTSP